MWGVMSPNSRYFQRKMERAFGVRDYVPISRAGVIGESLEDSLGNPKITDVYVCTPTLTHSKIVWQLLEAGKNVLVEKGWWGEPDPEKMLELAESNRLHLDVAYQPLFAEGRPKIPEFTAMGAKFLLPLGGSPVLFEDIGFYPVMEMCLATEKTPPETFSFFREGVYECWREDDRIWSIIFSADHKFHQELIFDLEPVQEPFTSRTDLRRYERVIENFENSAGISETARVFPRVRKVLEEMKNACQV